MTNLFNLNLSPFIPDQLREYFLNTFLLPKHRFPPDFKLSDQDGFCGGYFVSYNRELAPKVLLQLCKENRWQDLNSVIGDFLIIFASFQDNKVYVLTDQTGKFPCFFASEQNWFRLSTDFALVKEKVSQPKGNIEAIFEYLANGFTITDSTIISQIHQLPPATLLTINSDLSYSLTSLVDLDSFLAQPVNCYTEPSRFADDIVELLNVLIKERVKVLNSQPFGADLTSGFDSSLICALLKNVTKQKFFCLSAVAESVREDTSPAVISQFVAYHQLNHSFLPIDQYFPFSSFDLSWTAKRFYPGMHAVEWMDKAAQVFSNQGKIALFQGHGGDELYGGFQLEDGLKFAFQYDYFSSRVEGLSQYHLEAILTPAGVDELLREETLQNKRIFPVIIPPSVFLSNLYFPVWWEAGVWPLTPYIDPRLFQFARGIPYRGKEAHPKTEFWRHRLDLFVPEQFRPKGNFQGLVKQFIKQRSDIVVSVLKNSILGRAGWIRSEEIVEDFQAGREEKYLDDAISTYLHNLVRLEYFLQANKVKVG